MEALRLANHKRFGASSEKSEETLTEQLSFLFNEAEVFAAAEQEETVTEVAAHKRRKKNNDYTPWIISRRSGSSTAWRATIWCAPVRYHDRDRHTFL